MDPKQADKICTMVRDLCNKHEGYILSCTLDWTIMEVSHPRYSQKIQMVVPLLDIQYK